LKKNKWKIPLYKVLNDEDDVKAVSKVIKRGMDWAIGPEIEKFENTLAKYIGTKYCLAFNSGTSAGHAALLCYKLGLNSEILVPSFSFIATANWPLMVNSKPKFLDIDKTTYGLDPEKLENMISKSTKMIIPIHYGGLPCKISEIKKIAKDHKIALIEDVAESIGAEINNKKVGTFGEMAVFSFAGNKVITSGEGGAIVTNSKEKYEKLKLIRSHGRKVSKNYFSSVQTPEYLELGYNWRMSSITAALALSQLNKINMLIKLRRKNAKIYKKKLKNSQEIQTHSEPAQYKHVYQLFSIQLQSKSKRDGLMRFLTSRGIMSKVFFDPIHMTQHFSVYKVKNQHLAMTEKISERILSIPMYPGLTKEEITMVANTINEFVEQQ